MSEQVSPLIAWFIVISVALIPGAATIFVLMSLITDVRIPYHKRPPVDEPLTILVAAYNEASAIADTLASVGHQDYPGPVRVIVIDDGSTDETAAMVEAFIAANRHPRMTVDLIRQPKNGGKSHALNTGLAEVETRLTVTIDGDTYLHREALSNIVKAMVYAEPKVAAVAGCILVRNSRTNFLTKMQEWDYFHGIGVVKRAQSLYHGTLVAQGAFSIYDTAALREAGGWREVVGEDIVLTWTLRGNGHNVGYSECAFAFTNAPTSFRQFFRQRQRWARGLIEAFKSTPQAIVQLRLNSPFVWYNMFFPLIDFAYLFILVPGIIAAFFGYHLIAGLLTLLLVPMVIIGTAIYYKYEKEIFDEHDLHVRRNFLGLLGYMFVYQFIMAAASLSGYFNEFFNLKKNWGTK